MPAEWEPQNAIMLTWPHKETDWEPYLDDITETFLQMAEVITRYEQLLVVSQTAELTRKALTERLGTEAMKKVTITSCPTNDTWARDHGPITLLPYDKEQQPVFMDFRFNGWGEKFPADKDNRITEHLCTTETLKGRRVDCDDFVLEGGSIESDGEGTIYTTSHCLLAPHRNQPMNEDEICFELMRRLDATSLRLLHHGYLVGDDTDGHIDTLVRTAPNNTLLYVKCDDPKDEQYEELRLMEEELQSITNAHGQQCRTVPLPMPNPIIFEGRRLPATYANFVIINGAVIVPTYQQPDKDKKALHIIGQAFPGRDIIGIDATTVIKQNGSLHCLTMQLPAGVLTNNQ